MNSRTLVGSVRRTGTLDGREVIAMHKIWAIFTILLGSLAADLGADHWPNWRGPSASGVSREQGLPVRWSDSENIAWKAPLRGLGISSPIVWGDLVFVTSQAGNGVVRPGPAAGAERQPDGGRRAASRRRADERRWQSRLSRHRVRSRERSAAPGSSSCRRKGRFPRFTRNTISHRPVR